MTRLLRLRSLLVLCLTLGVVQMASAQSMGLQGHPQKGVYASPAEWPPVDAQCWVNDPDPLKAGHIHLVQKAPAYARILNFNTFEVPFTLKAHNIDGVIGLVQGEHIKSFKWDATGTAEAPIMRGINPGVVEWSGVMTVDLSLGDDFLHIFKWPLHGWNEVRLFTRTAFTDGKILDASATFPLYSAIDVTVPETPAPEQGNPGVHHRASCVLYDAKGVPIAGEVITEAANYVPLAPIFGPWTIFVNAYNYTAPAGVALLDQLFEQRLDPDLHHGVPGSLIRRDVITAGMNKQLVSPFVLDPAVMGTGDHKSMIVWTQPFPTQAVSSVIVFPVTVGQGVPPPTICTDPTATNTNKPLPCTYPTVTDLCPNIDGVQATIPVGMSLVNGQCVTTTPPPPPPTVTWETIQGVFQRLGTEDRYRLCVTPDHCVELVIK